MFNLFYQDLPASRQTDEETARRTSITLAIPPNACMRKTQYLMPVFELNNSTRIQFRISLLEYSDQPRFLLELVY